MALTSRRAIIRLSRLKLLFALSEGSQNRFLDGLVSEAKILDFLDMSYDLIDGAGRKENK